MKPDTAGVRRPTACGECDLLLPVLPQQWRLPSGTRFLLWECFDPECGSFVIQFTGGYATRDILKIRELFGRLQVETDGRRALQLVLAQAEEETASNG